MKTTTRLTIDDYMKMPYRTEVYDDRAGDTVCYMAYNPELEGCMAQGATPYDAVAALKEARRLYIGVLLNRNLAVPLPAGYSDTPIHFRIVPIPSVAPTNTDTKRGVQYSLAA